MSARRPQTLDPTRVIAALAPLISEERAARMRAVLAARVHGVVVVLEDLHDPHNGAAALRSLEALGVGRVHVIERAEPFRFSSKVTQGCERWLELSRHPTPVAGLAALRTAGYAAYGAVPGARLALADLPWERPVALLFGNEHAGLSAEARAGCDAEFGIELSGMTRSFNLSVAVALAAREAVTRRRAAIGAPGDLDEATRLRKLADWFYEDVRGARAIVERSGA